MKRSRQFWAELPVPLCGTDLTATWTYSPSSGPLRLQQHQPRGGTTVFTYDACGRVQTVSRGPSATDLRERIETTYDPLTGKKSLERTLAFEGASWVEKRRQSFAYDAEGRLQTVTHADGAALHYAYDAADRIASVRDENHSTPNTLYAYDPAGRLDTMTQTLAGAPGGVITTRNTYDLHGNLTSVTGSERQRDPLHLRRLWATAPSAESGHRRDQLHLR